MFCNSLDPYAPGEISNRNVTPNSMLFTWNNTARDPMGHKVTLAPSHGEIGNATDGGDGVYSVEVVNLRPGQRYNVSVQVYSCDGFSVPSTTMIRTVVIRKYFWSVYRPAVSYWLNIPGFIRFLGKIMCL